MEANVTPEANRSESTRQQTVQGPPTLPPTRRIQKWQLAVAVIATATAVSGIWFMYLQQERRHAADLERSGANISIQGGLRPVRWRGPSEARVPIGWEAWFFVIGEGPATAKQFIVNVWPTGSKNMWHGEPEIISPPTAGHVQVVDKGAGGLYQVVVTNLQRGDGFLMAIPFAPGGDEVDRVASLWRTSMFSLEFTKRFISAVDGVGENVHVSNNGASKFGSMRTASER